MKLMFKTTVAFTLGMHAAAHLAYCHPERATLRTIAGLCESSEAHLAKVIRALARSGIVKAERGPSGGITLDGDPRSISLLDIWNAIEGPPAAVACPFTIPSCKKGQCSLGRIFGEYNGKMEKIMAKTTLDALGDMCSVKKPAVKRSDSTRTVARKCCG